MKYSFLEVVDNVLKSNLKCESKHSSFTDALFECLNEHKSKVLLVDSDSGREWTAQQLQEKIITLSVRFLELGISKGDVVACFAPNSDFQVITMISLWSIGAIYTALYFKSPLRELNNLISKTSATYLIGSHETIDIFNEFKLKTAFKIKRYFVIDNRSDHSNEKIYSIESLVESEVSENERNNFFKRLSSLKLEDICKIGFSSGTTGEPKALLETNKRMLAFGFMSPPEFDLVNRNDICAVLQPLHHASATSLLCLSLLKAAKNIVFSCFDCNDFIKKVNKYGISFAAIVASNINLLNRTFHDTPKKLSLKKVLVGGEFSPESKSKEFVAKFKPEYYGQGYGACEAGWITITPVSEGVNNLSSIGVPLPGYSIKIVSLTTGETLGPNQKGEICGKGPQAVKGYLNASLNKDAFDGENFVKTGDIGYYDENGFLYCVERIKQIIKYRGQQVSPTELQNILLQHESVKEAAVVGIDDEIYGELPKAFVVLRNEFKGKIMENDLIVFVNNQVGEYKKLRGGLRFLDELPKTAIGKIQSSLLKSM